MIHAGIPFPLLYFKGMRLMMFQLSSFYYTKIPFKVSDLGLKVDLHGWLSELGSLFGSLI